MGGGQNIKNQNIKGSDHRKFFRIIRKLKVKKITTSKDHNIKSQNVESDLPMAFGLLDLT